MQKCALIFADGQLGVGLGHISRSKALETELQSQNFQTTFLDSAFLLKSHSIASYYDLIAIDSYILPLESYKEATKHAKICLFFDDTLRLDYPYGIIINNAIGVDFQAYLEKYKYHILFLGNNYRLMRKEFLEILKKNQASPPPLKQTIKNILITFGGKDILHLNQPLTFLLSTTYPEHKFHCITDSTLSATIQTHSNLSAQEMVSLISSMDVCICACGQTLGEILSCGIPAIALEIAENQNANLKSFQSCTLNLSKAYLEKTDLLCQKILKLLDSYSYQLRLMHQQKALAILSQPTLWKENLPKVFEVSKTQ